MVHRCGIAALLLAAVALADVAVPIDGPVLRGVVRVDAKRNKVVVGEEELPLDQFLLVERTDGTLVWSGGVAARLQGYHKIVFAARRSKLVALAKEAVRARDRKTARRLYERAKREGLTGTDERVVRKRVENLEKKTRKVNTERAAPVREAEAALANQLPAFLLARARLERKRGEDGLRLVRAILADAPKYEPALALLAEHVPADSPFEKSRDWLDWHLDLAAYGFELVPEDDVALKRARHYWRPDLYGVRSAELLLLTPIRDMSVIAPVCRRAQISLRKIRELFRTDKPMVRSKEPLTVYLYADRQNFAEQVSDEGADPLPPAFLWVSGRWNLKQDISRFLWPKTKKRQDYMLYGLVHEVVRHWLWSRNPRYSSKQLMDADGAIAGYWAVVGLVGMFAEAQFDLDEGTIDLGAGSGYSRGVVRDADRLVAWNRFFLMSIEDVWTLRKTKIGKESAAFFYARQATSACYFLYHFQEGRFRTRLCDFVVNYYLGNQPKLAPSVAFGLSAAELGRAVMNHIGER